MAPKLPPFITLEEHFLSPPFLASPLYAEQLKHIPSLSTHLSSLSTARLASMDASSISLQIVSHGPTGGPITPEQCRSANLQLAAAVNAHPTRFAGFAVLPVDEPDECSKELAFCVEELGFVGALIDCHDSRGRHFDGAEWGGFWYTVQALGVPVYLHPTWLTEGQRRGVVGEQVDGGRVSEGAIRSLCSSGWGWHSDVAVGFLKMFAAGVFDRFPRLKIVLGHMGEMIPFMLQRIVQLSVRWGERQRMFKQVWDENVWVTTSGVWSVDPMATVLRNTRIERVLFSVDWPFAKNEDGVRFMEDLRESGLVDESGLEMIAYKNAEKLLGVTVIRDEEEGAEEQHEERGEQAMQTGTVAVEARQ